MSKRFWFNVLVVAGLCAGPALAQSLVRIDPATVTNGHVYLMENVGANVPDDSANNTNGNLLGSPQVVDGLNGKALQFNGTSDGIHLPDAATINTSIHQNKTVIAVFKCADVSKSEKQVIYEEGGSTRGLCIYVHQGLAYAGAWNRGDYTPDFPGTWLSAPIGSNEWHVVAAVLRGGGAGQADDKFEMWLDGTLIAKGPGGELRGRSDDNGIANVRQQTRVHNGEVLNAGYWFEGAIDELWILNQALSEDVLSSIGVSQTKARNPAPASGATDVPRDTALAWEAGASARTHDVYLGTVFADVNTAGRVDAKGTLASRGQTATQYQPQAPLEYGRTYFWRIDEVNGAPDNTIFKGDTWSFTVESYGYPITNVTATASSFQPGMEPQNTVNRSGLNAADEHSTSETQMWLSAGLQPTWIQYEFDQAYKLYELWVWNQNQIIEPYLGFGAKDVKIEYSVDGSTWTQLQDVPEFARGSGLPTYTANTTVSFGGVSAKYVKLTIEKGWGGLPQTGLSEVRFFYVPLQAREPIPAAGATGIALDPTLSWRPGREAASHTVYVGTDQEAVAKGTAPAKSLTNRRFDPPTLELGTTYFWKVDEVGATGTHAGEVWSFTTKEYQVVDDFESYTDKPGAEIFTAWVDGFDTPTRNGALVGLDTAVKGTFGETTIIHGDKQSMPLAYDNTQAPLSEAVLTFAPPQNWTINGIKSLSLWFRGVAGNGGQLYVKINGAKVLYDGEATDLARATWQVWNIDLSKVGSVNSVRSLAVGIEGAGAKGLLYLDDVRLYPRLPQYLTPVAPDAASLQAQYLFDGNANDSSGRGRHGAVLGGAGYAAGKVGQALSFDGLDDYVTVDTYTGILGGNPFTITAWVKSLAADDRTMVNWGSATNGQRVDFRLFEGRLRVEHGNGNLQGNTRLADDEWHHVACVVGPDAAIQQPDTVLYLDGKNDSQTTADPDKFTIVADVPVTMGQRRTHNDRMFLGLLDDVRIYDRVLSAAEVAGLAGLTKPIHVPF